ncbi:hypothetical protein LD13_gp092 [Bacillus phage Bobb]|uniref:Uncharacterized protein n=1 Tax=Bacillus phage Bobb TaxID=1527469 RepID=A0A076G8S6_9CAUD|nr:hypothetical protein LD13_gp092 [Bacillus phage Bobb]AII27993.1 hypothetical protein [Bacillus phage Bobb]
MIVEIITFIELMILMFISIFGMVFCDRKKDRIIFFIFAVGFLGLLGLVSWVNWFN